MNKKELIAKIAANTLLSKVEARQALDATLCLIENKLSEGKRVTLSGFGTFMISHHVERNGVNPRTQEPIINKAYDTVKFKPSADMKKLKVKK